VRVHPPSILRKWPITAVLIISLPAVGAETAAGSLSVDWQLRVTPRVQSILTSVRSPSASSSQAAGINSTPAARQAGSSARYDSKGRLHIDIEFDCTKAPPRAALVAAGMIIGTVVKAPPMCVVEGWAAVASVPTLASVPTVTKIDLPKYSKLHPPISPHSQMTVIGTSIAMAANGTPAINGNGITIMNVDKFSQQTGVNGAGITIGVISTDVTSLALIQGRGELPTSVNVVQPSANPMVHSSLTDEGTMMLEEVYAVAPGAKLVFCGPETGVEYLGCVQNLIAAGVTVVSDDLGFPGFDVMSATQNAAALALENLLTASPNVMLYHSAGNDAQDYWQGAYSPLNVPGGGTCSPPGQASQTDNYFQQFGSNTHITWQTNGGKDLLLASVVPTGQSNPSSFDVYVYNPGTAQVVTCSTSATGWTDGSTSYSFVAGSQIPQGNYYILIGTTDASLSSTFLKLIGNDDGGGTFSPLSPGAPSSLQDFASGVTTVGAVYGNDGIGNSIEAYSDTGPIQLEFPAASILQAPIIVAPDAIYVDNNGTLFPSSGGIFHGTSAASPNAAAVAVLLRSAFPTLTPAQITTSIETGAAPLGSFSPNSTFGYGRVDTLGALASIPAPGVTGLQGISIVGGSPPTVLAFTVIGTGVINVTTASSIGLSGSGSMGVTVSPANCGNPVTACTLILAPVAGSFGTGNVQVTATDGAHRAQSPQMTVVVTKPAPPTVTITSGGSQSVVVNAAIAPVAFTLNGTGPLVVTPASNNVSTLTISSGCGTTVMMCTANLGTAMSTAATASVTLTVNDGYGQSASASATVTETNPPSSGGGGLDRWTLLALGCIVLLQGFGMKRKTSG
jgi:hypothetical protein